jgi:hypothetical protein
VVAVPEGVVNTLDTVYTNFPKIQEPHTIPNAISVARSEFHTEDPQILAPTYKTLLSRCLCTWNLCASDLEDKKWAEMMDLFLRCYQSHLLKKVLMYN